jgi:hypothetical protein
MTIGKLKNLTNNSLRKHNNFLSFIILILQHIPIAMITKTCNRKQSCCTVTYCPLVTAWATTIHTFQQFKAWFNLNDHFKHLIVDPGNLTTKQHNSEMLYAAMSRAKTMGQMTPNKPNPKDSAIFWIKIFKRQEWVNHLLE